MKAERTPGAISTVWTTHGNSGIGSGSPQMGQVKHVKPQATSPSGVPHGSRGAAAQGKIPKRRKVGSSIHGPTGSHWKSISSPPIMAGGESTTTGGGEETGASCLRERARPTTVGLKKKRGGAFNSSVSPFKALNLHQGMAHQGYRIMESLLRLGRRTASRTGQGCLGHMPRCQQRSGTPAAYKLQERFHLHSHYAFSSQVVQFHMPLSFDLLLGLVSTTE